MAIGLPEIISGIGAIGGLLGGKSESKSSSRSLRGGEQNLAWAKEMATPQDWRSFLTPGERELLMGPGMLSLADYRNQAQGDIRASAGRRGLLDSSYYASAGPGIEDTYHRGRGLLLKDIMGTEFGMARDWNQLRLGAAGIGSGLAGQQLGLGQWQGQQAADYFGGAGASLADLATGYGTRRPRYSGDMTEAEWRAARARVAALGYGVGGHHG